MKQPTTVISGRCLLVLLLFWPVFALSQTLPVDELIERARNAGVDQQRIEELRSRAEGQGIGPEGVAAILEPAVGLAEQGLPSEMIFQKSFEGMAKGIPPARMMPVLQQIRNHTESIMPMVDEWMARPDVGQMLERSDGRFDRESFRNEMLSVSSRAVSGQTGPALVQEILTGMAEAGLPARAAPAQMLAAVRVIGDIPGAGERPEEARAVVVRALQSGFSADDLQRLPAAMNMASRRSQMPAAVVLENTGRQMEGGVPAAEILQNLFNGHIGTGPPGQRPGGMDSRPGRRPDGAGRP